MISDGMAGRRISYPHPACTGLPPAAFLASLTEQPAQAVQEARMNYYRRYPGDYQRDTAHLSLAEHGAYAILLDHVYGSEQPLPIDLPAIYRLCRATTRAEREAVESVVRQFFPKDESGGRMNPRAREELLHAADAIEKMRTAGKEGAKRRWGKHREPYREPYPNPNGDPNGVSIDPPSSTSSSIAREEEGASAPPPPKAPPCPFEKIRDRYNSAASAIGMPRCTKLPETLKRSIRARWATNPEAGDDLEEFFRRVESQPFLGGQNDRGWRASLDWLMKPANFQKVLDEHYHTPEPEQRAAWR